MFLNRTEENFRNNCYTIRSINQGKDFELTFQMTSECNFRCTYCYETKVPGSIKLESAYKVIDKLFDIQDHKEWWNKFIREDVYDKDNISFNFFGGECTLEAENMDKICQYFMDKCNADPEKYAERIKNFRMTFQTNGYLLQSEKVKHFLSKWHDRIEFMFITIDGSKEMHDACRVLRDGGTGTWQVVHDNILWIRKTYPNLFIVTKGTITPSTISCLYDSFLAYFDSGFKEGIKMTLQEDVDWPEESLAIAEEQYRKIMEYCLKHPAIAVRRAPFVLFNVLDPMTGPDHSMKNTCPVGTCHCDGGGLCLTPRDELYVCFNFSPISIPDNYNRPKKILGTVEGGITDEGMKVINEMMTVHDKHIIETEECGSCTSRVYCEFCPGISYKHTGDMNNDPKRACKVRKIQCKYALLYQYYYKKIYGNNLVEGLSR